VVLTPEDAPWLASYRYREISDGEVSVKVLESSPDGSCAHLGPSGCEIYDRRPYVCRQFDCRMAFKSASARERADFASRQVWEAARRRLHTLDAADLAGLAAYRGRAEEAFARLADALDGPQAASPAGTAAE
jgi:Fe-S-cluster containining protein